MAPSRLTMAAAGLLATSINFPWHAVRAATLPIPCVAGVCGANNPFVALGKASAVQVGSTLTVNQTSQNVSLNWQSFNISADGTVNFVQPNSSAVALNRIFDANPTQIFGALNANGRVYLLNGNGIIFGAGAQVNVGSLVASSLNTTIDSGTNNYSLLAPGTNGQSAFQQFIDPNTGQPLNHSVVIQQGANLKTAEGGQVLVFAPTIVNEGNINTPGGQTVLAAGTQVYLASTDLNIRGLLVEVTADNGTQTSVTNGNQSADAKTTNPAQLVGQILAERGNVTLAGLAVNQFGRITATTSVNENGSIRLQAGTGTVAEAQGAISGRIQAGTGGTLTLGPRSDTEVTLDTTDTSTTVDSISQPKSNVTLLGATVNILDNSTVRATSGTIEAKAARDQAELYQQDSTGALVAGSGFTGTQDGSRVYVAPGATLDVSGASVTLPVSSNIISAQLRGTELADSPLQQNGPLHGETVNFDIRSHGTNPDGTSWQGTPLANVSGEIAAIQRNVNERNLTGGTITLQSQGDVIVAPAAALDIAGGQINFTGGMVDTTTLLTTTGKSVPIGSADPNALYVGVLHGATVSDPKWGTTRTYGNITGQYEQGYVQGFDAGTLNLSAPKFVLDGAVNGSTTAGIYQRLPDTAPITGSTNFLGYDGQGTQYLYRPYDQVALGATLNVGGAGTTADASINELVVGNVTLQSGTLLAGLRNADGSAFNPLTDPLPALFATSVLRPELLGGSSGFSNLSIRTDGEFLQPAAVSLRLPGGGTYSVEASLVDIEGSVDAPGGNISGAAVYTSSSPKLGTSLTLGPQAALTARGEWINDSPSLYAGGLNTAPLFINGGSVSLSSQANVGASSILTLSPGSLIDVSGGAQLTRTGALVNGTGGKITLRALPQTNVTDVRSQQLEPAQLELGATLRGFGLTNGGTLSLSAGAVCIAASDCSQGDLNTLWLTPASFATGGFANYNITADQGGLTVAPGTNLPLRQQNLTLASGFSGVGNSATMPVLATPALLPDAVRKPVNLTLNQVVQPNAYVTVLGSSQDYLHVTPTVPSLEIGAGAVLAADPSASMSLASNTRIIVDGTLSAPGGSINLSLSSPTLDPLSFAPTEGIWLGSRGVLDVHGVPQIQVAANGVRSGNVLNGGTVSLTAKDGYIELLPGSLIDVAGGSGTIDVVQFARSPRSELIGSAGGSVTLSAAAGMILGGSFDAAGGPAGPVGATPPGGSLTVELNNIQPPPDFAAGVTPELVLSSSLAPLVIAPGSAVPDGLYATALVPADAIAKGGFDSLTLKVANFSPLGVGNPLPGEIAFNGNVNLFLGQQLTLDAGIYSVSPGAMAQLYAPYVEFGNSDQRAYINLGTTYALPTDLQLGTGPSGTLNVAGNFLELYGWMALEGVGKASFDSTGDLRLTGFQDLSVNAVAPLGGGLFTGGDLELSAGQIYPSTLSQFEIAAGVSTGVNPTVPTSGTITINPSPTANTNTELLSAAGSVKLLASTIDQQGVLRAPFGTLDLEANNINLAAGSLTSTSSDGLTVPFGTTQGGFDWVYTLLNNISIVYGTDGVSLPAQHVTLNGRNVAIDKGAVVDVSGGGDLQAYEWIPGVGGTKDVLSQLVRPNQYAVVPGLKANVAPYDPSLSPGDGLQLGQTVYLSASPGLPAGYYTLLPARYALLPGAFLVSKTTGTAYRDLPPGKTYAAPGGGTIVSGYMTIAGTPLGASRTSGFTVVPASVVLGQAQNVNGQTQYTGGQAQYDTTSANRFFANQAVAANATPGRLPEDSGILDLVASVGLTLDGTLHANTKEGLGAAVDISSSQIVIGTDASTPVHDGQLLVTTDSLNQLEAQTLLIGGQLSSAGAINTVSSQVTLASGASLTGPEVLLTATDQVTVSNGASITANGSAARTRAYTLTGDSAFLSVASGPQATVTHTGSLGNTGVLTLASGSSLTANQGSLFLDASKNVVTQGSINAAGGDLALQSTRIAVGTPPPTAGNTNPGTVLDPALLATGGLRNVLLSSEQTIDFYGSTRFSAQNLTLDAQGLSGYGTSGDAALFTATGTLALLNSHPSMSGTPIPGTGSGSLSLDATNIGIGPGALSATGFSTLALNAQQTIMGLATKRASAESVDNPTAVVNKNASLTTDGNLAITAAQITTDAGVSMALTATNGAVTMLAPTQAASSSPITALGGSLFVSGTSVELGTQIVMPSGKVSLISASSDTTRGSDIVLDSGAGISVAGLTRTYNGTNVPTSGGTVTLTSARNVNLASGSTIDVSAATGGTGGSLSIAAPTGSVVISGSLLGSGSGAQGAAFSVDAQTFDFASLNNALGGGFSASRGFRLRGDSTTCTQNCDLVVTAATSINASSISLETDNGSVEIDGTLNASGTRGGSVTLAAANNLIVNGTISANATAAGGRGGQVQLGLGNSSTGSLQLNSGSVIDVSGGGPDSDGNAGTGGGVLLRVPGSLALKQATSGGTGIVLSGSIQGSSRTALEAVTVYSNAPGGLIDSTGIISSTAIDYINTDIASFMSNASLASYSGQLSQTLGSAFALEPGVEIDGVQTPDDASGALQLNTPWNLYGWRFGSNGTVPGVLTLRAAGGLTINSQLSDGFTTTSSFTLPTTQTNSWSYRLAAGADLTAANPLTVSSDPANLADFNIAACAAHCSPNATGGRGGGTAIYTPNMVRTGNGFIDVSAAHDFILGTPDGTGNWQPGSQAALLYTAGVIDPAGLVVSPSRSTVGLTYPVNGGDINISANRDVTAESSAQFVNQWLWRFAPVASGTNAHPTAAWTVDFTHFQQGIGALGGGDISIHAGEDVTNVSASTASVGIPIGPSLANSTLQIAGGGNLTVQAGGSILGGSYYDGLGALKLSAGEDVGIAAAVSAGNSAQLAPLLGLADGSISVTARGGVQLAGIANPTLLNPGTTAPSIGYFSTYGSSSSVSLTAIGGDVVLDDESSALSSIIGNSFLGGITPTVNGTASPWILDVLPPTLQANALSGNIRLGRSMILNPSAKGNLQLFADQSVLVGDPAGGEVEIVVPDTDPALIPGLTTASASTEQAYVDIFGDVEAGTKSSDLYSITPLHAGDTHPVQIVARTGDVYFSPPITNDLNILWSAKPVQVFAGRDVNNLDLVAQNLAASDVTSITARRDIIYPQTRQPGTGAISTNTNQLILGGPGELELTAGRDVNLGTSTGINTTGNLVNTALPKGGANVSITAGTSPTNPEQVAAFIGEYIDGTTQFDRELVSFVETATGQSNFSAKDAKTRFDGMSKGLQTAFVEQVFFDLLRAGGRTAAAAGPHHNDYSTAYAALEKLFPGSNPNLSAGQKVPYSGDILLYFSQVYTDQGGNISLLAPGGEINAGQAQPPSAIGIAKPANKLGIVAQQAGNINALSYSDFQVNQSRVFASYGGDILVWSTEGNIDAGRGSKTSLSAAAATVNIDPSSGAPIVTLSPPATGSGIQALALVAGTKPGDVDLFAPHGVVNANDAGIVAGNLTIAATAVLGTNNITVSGTSVGVPVAVTGLGANAVGASSSAAGNVNSATNSFESREDKSKTPEADTALGWLDVFVLGFGEEACKADDADCMKRQSQK